jgi:hypothetical protein
MADAGQVVAAGTTLLYNAVHLSCFNDAAWLRPIERSADPDRLCRRSRQPELRSSQLWRLENESPMTVKSSAVWPSA